MQTNILSPIIRAPGFSRISIYSALNYGQAIRDQYVWEFPILPGALYTYQQMASGRELKVSGFAKGVSRTIEWLQAAETKTYDGTTYVGFEDFLKRRVLDYLCVGRTALAAPADGPLEYLDPCRLSFDLHNRTWRDLLYNRTFAEQDVVINHPIPVGSSGAFMSPLAFLIPTAMLAWLVREHDKAAVDGRKLREVIIVQGKELADNLADAIEQMIQLYSGADVTKAGVPVVYVDGAQDGSGGKLPVQDLIGRIGISEIPDKFDRAGFQFEYVNEIAAALGISLRHFWNSEKATNRALEEVQEARQASKGPSSYVRTEQSILNRPHLLKRFGSNIRMAFIEEVDVQSRIANAGVLKSYAESAAIINTLAPGMINLDALFGWLQGDDILPSDVEILNPNWKDSPQAKAQTQTMETTGKIGTPGQNGEVQRGMNQQPGTMVQKDLNYADFDEIQYGEISMDMNGRIIERRNKPFTVEKMLADELRRDPVYMKQVAESETVLDFDDIVKQARIKNFDTFKSLEKSLVEELVTASGISPDDWERLEKVYDNRADATDVDHTLIGHIILKQINQDAEK